MKEINRRQFMKTTSAFGLGASFLLPNILTGKDDRKVRIGFIGVGLRGRNHLNELVRRDDVVIPSICDLNKDALAEAQSMIQKSGRKKAEEYSKGPESFKDMIARNDLDGVIISTPWDLHVPMAVATMKAGKYVGLEVSAAQTIQECWDLVNTSESTGVHCMLLENVCYRRDAMAALNMVRKGLFGEVVHAECGYLHDLRNILIQPGAEFGEKGKDEAKWRTEHYVKRDGDVYPTHGIGPVANCLNIDRGNRFLSLTSTASKARGLHEYIVEKGGETHPNAKVNFKLGDVITTLINCANGESIMVTHDTTLPRPYSLGFKIQGTKGLWMDVNQSIHIEGKTKPHEWEPFKKYQDEFDHAVWKKFGAEAEGSGHGGMDFFVDRAFVECVKNKIAPPIDVYDAASWSAITPLSEESIAGGSKPVEFPDFTKGKWKTNKPIFGLSNDY